jgi:cysteine synthase A
MSKPYTTSDALQNPSLRKFLKNAAFSAAALGFPPLFADPQYQSLALTEGATGQDADWVRQAILTLWQEREMGRITPLIRLRVPFQPKISIYFKNESKSPTGSLKHRVAWGLLMDALVNGKIGPQSRLYEASSGNTAIAEAYFSKLLDLPFTAVVRPGTSEGKLNAIRGFGGQVKIVADGQSPAAYIAEVLSNDKLAYNINQFANTEKSLDYFRGRTDLSMNIANEVFKQLHQGYHMTCPEWFVAGAGSGGTATSIARFIRKWADQGNSGLARLAVVDPEDSALYSWYQTGDPNVTVSKGSRIEGIGSRGPVIFGSTFSLLREGVTRMIKVPDTDSIAGMKLVSRLIGQEVGPSTGTNFCGALHLADELAKRGEKASIVTIVCDDGSRYRDNYYNPTWLREAGLESNARLRRMETFWATGIWT